jgi:hypothetical protein
MRVAVSTVKELRLPKKSEVRLSGKSECQTATRVRPTQEATSRIPTDRSLMRAFSESLCWPWHSGSGGISGSSRNQPSHLVI